MIAGVERGDAPLPGEVGFRQAGAESLRGQRRADRTGVLHGQPRVFLGGEVQVLVSVERPRCVLLAGLPGIDRSLVEVGIIAAVGAAVLVDRQARGVQPLGELVDFAIDGRAHVAFVTGAVGGEGDVAAVVGVELFEILLRLEELRDGRGRLVPVVRQFGLDHDADFVGGIKELGQLAVRVMPDVSEPVGFRKLQVLAVHFSGGRRAQSERIDVVVTEATDEVLLVVEVEVAAAHLPLADAESLDPAVDWLAVDLQDHVGPVEVGFLRRPGAQ